jgi:hypothetical protein
MAGESSGAVQAPQHSGEQSGAFEQGGGGGTGGQGVRRDGGSGAQVFDYKKAFESQRRELGESRSSMEKLVKDFQGYKQQVNPEIETLRRLKDALNPPEHEADPTQAEIREMEQELDYIIAQGIEADKRGQPMPLTIHNAVRQIKAQIEAKKKEASLNTELEQMKRQLDELRSPDAAINQTAFQTLDQTIIRGVEQLFGKDQGTFDSRKAMFRAATDLLVPYVREMIQKAPGEWEMLRRDPQALADLAQRALKKVIPPKALQVLAQEQLENTPMRESELFQAFAEARSIRDPQKRQEIQEQIRQEILELRFRQGKLGNIGRRQ